MAIYEKNESYSDRKYVQQDSEEAFSGFSLQKTTMEQHNKAE